MFSDTVVLSKGNWPDITNNTTLPVQHSAIEASEVYVDEDATLCVIEKQQPDMSQKNSEKPAFPRIWSTFFFISYHCNLQQMMLGTTRKS
ncbi:unnamed protein product [Cylicocyclus nassatus]|uniref:Uncharacterized protein n=1 Tax=Cylicocyclus nassatus TaxID=53992 RepID=A0AA36DUA5_CYLNA|nr:unnamed protein product [Cylicocyclus nassatus]